MLMLALDIRLGAGRNLLPEHLGGVLHGTLEAAALAHAPHLIGVLRPTGDNAPARFAVHAPPPVNSSANRREMPSGAECGGETQLRFGVLLYGEASSLWRDLLEALHRQMRQRIQGRTAELAGATVWQPGAHPVCVIDEGSWLKVSHNVSTDHDLLLADEAKASLGGATPCLHQLSLRAPLLLASRGAAREGLRQFGELPWPTLGSVLDSIAQRVRTLEPRLAQHLGLSAHWVASDRARNTEPLTPAAEPAHQVEWTYRATPRPKPGEREGGPQRRSIVLPGIVGNLLYPASNDPLERALLHWGQWIGVGQKTTMGCGQYVWTPL